VDPIYMVMLIRILGPEYIVWDKAASIRFKKPGRETLYATFHISDEEIQTIQSSLDTLPSIDRLYHVELVNAQGVVHALIDKTVYIRKKEGTGERLVNGG
jgi:hypothetical protein